MSEDGFDSGRITMMGRLVTMDGEPLCPPKGGAVLLKWLCGPLITLVLLYPKFSSSQTAITVSTNSEVEQQKHLERGIYWDYADVSSLVVDKTSKQVGSAAGALQYLREHHFNHLHFWLNDTFGRTVSCSAVFKYDYWTRSNVVTFIKYMHDAGIKVTLTIAPSVPSRKYIESLRDVFKIASIYADVDVEFDMEGNWTADWGPQNCDPTLRLGDAEAALLGAARQSLPGRAIGVNVPVNRFGQHTFLLRNADWVAPQLYGPDASAIPLILSELLSDFKVRSLRPIFDATAINAKGGGADLAKSLALFKSDFASVHTLDASVHRLVFEVVVWSRRQLKINDGAARYLETASLAPPP